jgi:UDP-glucose 4-epimerase
MTVLVTGGAGYIGSHTARALREAGHDIVVLDSLEFGSEKAVLGAPLVVGDINDHDLVSQTCKEFNVTSCIHFAAYKSVGESMEQPARYIRNNVAGTAALAGSLAACGVDKIVFSSSCSVYGTPAHVPVTEDAPIHPESVYADTKAMSERVLQWFDTTHGMRSVSLRYFNAAGASMDAAIGEDWTVTLNLIPIVMKALLGKRGPLEVFGTDYPTPDGTAVRDYIHVEDLASAHIKAIEYLHSGGATTAVNTGTGTGSSVLEVINATERITGKKVPHTFGPRRAGDPSATFADPRTCEMILGWKAVHGLDAIIESAYRWHAASI